LAALTRGTEQVKAYDLSPGLDEYDSDIRCYASATLREKLSKLRGKIAPSAGGIIHDRPWAIWRRNAGLVSGTGDSQIRTKVRFLTQKEAALIVLQALWKPKGTPGIVKRVVGSDMDAGELNSKHLCAFFNAWVAANGAEEAAELLHEIRGCPLTITGRNLSDLSVQILGGRAAIATIRGWAGTAIAMNNRPVDRRVAVRAIRAMLNHAESSKNKSPRS
jgi:hypothetical protein